MERRRFLTLAGGAAVVAGLGGCTARDEAPSPDSASSPARPSRGGTASPTSSGVPVAPHTVTSIAGDASATVSFHDDAEAAPGSVTHYLVTPYDGTTALPATAVAAGEVARVKGSSGRTALRVRVDGLANDTAYTFTVRAGSSRGDSDESVPSGENTPMSGLVFGDDFNGPAGAAPDPEWWVYDRCGYLAQDEVQWYTPSNCVLDGSGSLRLTAEHVDTSGPRYPSDPEYPGVVTQPWRSGACQSNTRTFAPSPGNALTFEARQRVCPNAGTGFWPGLFWLQGQDYLETWKTDPVQEGWDAAGKAEIDVAEWYLSGSPDSYGNVSWAGTNEQTSVRASGLSTSMHTYQAIWTPGSRVLFTRDGVTTAIHTGQVPGAGAQLFLLLYLQMLSGGPTATESCLVDHVRVFERPA